jgi:HEAT repeat protein
VRYIEVVIETDKFIERKEEMLAVDVNRTMEVEVRNIFGRLPETRQEDELEVLLAELTADAPWGKRRAAAKKIGKLRNPEALPAMLAALPVDRFWMVRCEIIQALERIADPAAVPTLRSVAENDRFEVVRVYAAKAVERLS